MPRNRSARVLFLAALAGLTPPAAAQTTWDIDNTTSIGGVAVVDVVGSPTVVPTPFGDGLRFDGNDGLIVDANPIAGAAA